VGNLVPNHSILLANLYRKHGFRIKLDELARETLGHQKAAMDWKSFSGGAMARKEESANIAKRCAIAGDLVEVRQEEKVRGREQAALAVEWD